MEEYHYTIVVDMTELPQPEIDSTESFIFADEEEAIKFRDHLRELYGLDVNYTLEFAHTYDTAIQQFVELAGPSSE